MRADCPRLRAAEGGGVAGRGLGNRARPPPPPPSKVGQLGKLHNPGLLAGTVHIDPSPLH